MDERGIRRMWMEPDSHTPDCYAGYELAQKAIAEQKENQPC